MKKCVCLCLMVAMLLSLCACGEEKEPMIEAVTTTATTTTGKVVTDATIASEPEVIITASNISAGTSAETVPDISAGTSAETATTTGKTATTSKQITGQTQINQPPSDSGVSYLIFELVPNALKPELRFFRQSVDLSELGEIVDLYFVNLSSGYCITADGALYEFASKPFSDTGKPYRQIPCEFTLARIITQRAFDTYFATTEGKIVTTRKDKDEFAEGNLPSYEEYFFAQDNQVMSVKGGVNTVVFSFPEGETVEYVTPTGYTRTEYKMAYTICAVRTNKGWYHLYRDTTYEDSGYADVDPIEKHTVTTKKMELEASVCLVTNLHSVYWWEDDPKGYCALLTTDGMLYFDPACQYNEKVGDYVPVE